MRVAIIDNDSGFTTVLGKRLDAAGWTYRLFETAPPLEDLMSLKLNAVIVDLSEFGPRGWEFIERLGAMLTGVGLIICTPHSTVAQRVRGLRLGADDWIGKPCHPEEVIARAEAVARRHRRGGAEESPPFVTGELEFHPDRFQVMIGGTPLDLTRREFELVHLLAGKAGRVLQREEIYREVWGYAMVRGDRSVDVFVRKLRIKLEHASPSWTYIHTHFGVGYRFAPEQPNEITIAPVPAPDVAAQATVARPLRELEQS